MVPALRVCTVLLGAVGDEKDWVLPQSIWERGWVIGSPSPCPDDQGVLPKGLVEELLGVLVQPASGGEAELQLGEPEEEAIISIRKKIHPASGSCDPN